MANRNVAIYPGSFDPFTNGHLDIVIKASKLFDKVHILISTNSTKKRTYDSLYMKEAIESTLRDLGILNCEVYVYDGLVAEYTKTNNIGYMIRGLRNNLDYNYEENLAEVNKLINSELEYVYFRAENVAISSSMVKELAGYGEDVSKFVPYNIFYIMRSNTGGTSMINNFSGEYFFLSNFYNAYLMYEGIIYCSTEAAFQAAKTLDVKEREKIARMSPSDAKAAGRKLELRPDWENVKDKVMYDVCRAKFTMNDSLGLRERLLATGDVELIEGNTWHDNYWGNCSCDKCKDKVGRNQLGKTLMMLRAELRKGTE